MRAIAVLLLLFDIGNIFDSNAIAIQKIPASRVVANATVPTQKQNQTRHFDWQKHGHAGHIEEEEEVDVAPVFGMTSAPIVSTPMANAMAVEVGQYSTVSANRDAPEMALSEFRAPEHVGDVASILWGASHTAATTTATVIHRAAGQPQHSLHSEVEVFRGRDPRQMGPTSTTSTTPKAKLKTEVEVFDIETLVPANLQSTTVSMTTSRSSSTGSTTTTTEANLYSAEETTQHHQSEARDLLGPPAKLRSAAPTMPIKQPSAMPSIDEDQIRTYTLKNKERYGHGHAKPRIITQELDRMNFTTFDEEHSKPIDFLANQNRTNVESSTHMTKMHREMSISMVAGRK